MGKLMEYRKKYDDTLTECRTLAEKDQLTADEQAGLDAKYAELDELRAKIERLEKFGTLESFNTRGSEPPAPVLKEEERAAIQTRERILDKPFTLTERCIAVRDAAKGLPLDPRFQEEREQRAPQGNNAGVGSQGGFYIGSTAIDINKKTYGNANSLVGMVDQQPIGEGADSAEWVDVDNGGSRKDTYRHGGVIGYYQGEADTIDFRTLKLEDGSLKLTELLAIVPATDRMLRDAVGFEAKAKKIIEKEFIFQINRGIVAGTGAAMPLGLRNAGAAKSITIEGGQLADTILYENVVNMYAGLLPESQASKNLAWLYHPTCFPQLAKMALTVGVGGVAAWMPANGISGAPYDTFFGKPAFPCEFLPELGNAKDIMLVDLEEYLWIYKGDVVVDISPHVYFTSNQTLFRFKQAVNGMPKHDRATTLYEGTGTVSPYVYTAERA